MARVLNLQHASSFASAFLLRSDERGRLMADEDDHSLGEVLAQAIERYRVMKPSEVDLVTRGVVLHVQNRIALGVAGRVESSSSEQQGSNER